MEDLRVLRFFPAKIGVPNPPSHWEVLLFGVPPSFVKSHILGDIPLHFTKWLLIAWCFIIYLVYPQCISRNIIPMISPSYPHHMLLFHQKSPPKKGTTCHACCHSTWPWSWGCWSCTPCRTSGYSCGSWAAMFLLCPYGYGSKLGTPKNRWWILNID